MDFQRKHGATHCKSVSRIAGTFGLVLLGTLKSTVETDLNTERAKVWLSSFTLTGEGKHLAHLSLQVLHIDRNNYYGGASASLNLKQVILDPSIGFGQGRWLSPLPCSLSIAFWGNAVRHRSSSVKVDVTSISGKQHLRLSNRYILRFHVARLCPLMYDAVVLCSCGRGSKPAATPLSSWEHPETTMWTLCLNSLCPLATW